MINNTEKLLIMGSTTNDIETLDLDKILFIEKGGNLGYKEISFKQLMVVLDSIELRWFGVHNWTRFDVDYVNDSIDCHIQFIEKKGVNWNKKTRDDVNNYTIQLHKNGYDFSHLYK